MAMGVDEYAGPAQILRKTIASSSIHFPTEHGAQPREGYRCRCRVCF
jgi:hypothetical protein